MELLSNTTTPTAATNETSASPPGKFASHRWEFLVAVLVTAVSISILTAVLAKCQVVRRYLASYRHTRLTDTDTVSQCDHSGGEVGFAMHRGRELDPHCVPPLDEDDDGFIEDNYIPASERARAQRAAEIMEVDTEEEMDDIEFSIS